MKIQVTQEDIDNGESGNGYLCPIAIALKRAGFKSPAVWDFIDDGDYQIKTPKKAFKWLLDFDTGIEVTPFEFEIPDALPKT